MNEYSYWVGFDDDAEKICVAILRGEDERPIAEFVVERNDRGMRRLLSQLKRLRGTVRCVYEAGPCGYGFAAMADKPWGDLPGGRTVVDAEEARQKGENEPNRCA